MDIKNLIIEEALKDLGTREVSGNKGWQVDFTLEDLIEEGVEYTEEDMQALKDRADAEVKRIAKFTRDMTTLGWQEGWAWCLFWSEYVWLRAYNRYNSFIAAKLQKLIKASATATWNEFKNGAGKSHFVVSKEPVKGAIAIWQKFKDGKADWRGHGAIVYGWDKEKNILKTIDGNSNSKGGREGIEVAKITRTFNFTEQNGLRLLGFIHPID